MSVTGIIKLSHIQAEGRRGKIAVLCLKYILSLAVTAVFIAMIFLRNSPNPDVLPLLTVCVVLTAVLAAGLRGTLHREMYRISEEYLRCDDDGAIPLPSASQLLGGELACIAAGFTVMAIMLAPSYICLRTGIEYYALSSERRVFMLMLASAICLLLGGVIFAAVVNARLYCAEYLWLRGECSNMLSALDRSWEITRDEWGDILRLKLTTPFCGCALSALNKMNASQSILRRNANHSTCELHIGILSDSNGEQRIELITI